MFGKIRKALKIDEFTSNVSDYIEARIELVKIEIKEALAGIIAWMITGIALLVAFIVAFIFLNLALAQGIGQALGQPWAGSLIVAAIWILVMLISFRTLTSPLRINSLKTQILDRIMAESIEKHNEEVVKEEAKEIVAEKIVDFEVQNSDLGSNTK
jgi:hypothetical protein